MRTFDTNVVVRLLVEDDREQCRLAEGAWRSALATGGVFIPKVVLVEVSWVLRTAYRFDRATIAMTLRQLLEVEGVEVEDAAEIHRALALFEDKDADFSDFVILEAARQHKSLPVGTFDRRFAKEADAELLDGTK